MARLVIFDETVRGVDLPGHPVILGRSKKADVPIHDKILSRKHCSIVPSASGLRLIDLKSSHGTYLNGKRIERSSLKFDDVIEIGDTVIVLLDTDTWRQGDGLDRLRNPRKAEKLGQALKQSASGKSEESGGAGDSPKPRSRKDARALALRDGKKLRAFEAVFAKWAKHELLSRPAAQDLIEGYVFHQVVSLAARHSSDLREVLAGALERVLAPDAFSGDAVTLRETIRASVADALARYRERGGGAK